MPWACRNFQRPMSAVLVGDVIGHDPKHPTEPFRIAMREDEGYILRLKKSEVLEFRLEGGAADAAKDTPFKHGVAVD